MVRPVLGSQRRRGRLDRPGARRAPAGDPVQPVQPGPGQRPRRPAGRAGQGRHRLGLRGPLLLGQRGLRRAVPHLHAPRARAQPHALPQPDAARGARPGPRDGPARRAVPVAHHQRRGGLGLLRGRHRAGAHRRRHRPRAGAVRRRHRRRRASWCATASPSSSRPPGCTPTSGSGAATASASFHIHGVTGPDEYTTVVNNNLFTNVMARYNLEQAVASVEWVREQEPDGVRPAGRSGWACTTTRSREWAAVRRGHAHPLRRGPRHPPAGRLLPRPRGVGPQPRPRRSCGRCCCTTTRW